VGKTTYSSTDEGKEKFKDENKRQREKKEAEEKKGKYR
jgi:hypothetical protein